MLFFQYQVFSPLCWWGCEICDTFVTVWGFRKLASYCTMNVSWTWLGCLQLDHALSMHIEWELSCYLFFHGSFCLLFHVVQSESEWLLLLSSCWCQSSWALQFVMCRVHSFLFLLQVCCSSSGKLEFRLQTFRGRIDTWRNSVSKDLSWSHKSHSQRTFYITYSTSLSPVLVPRFCR